jgi:5'-phosphate synthase pdxT subunit
MVTEPEVGGAADAGSHFVVGVLALQGDFARHEQAFRAVGAETRRVSTAADLAGCDALALPGGESTTLLRLLEVTGLREPLARFVAERPVFGTCAGLILLARELADGARVPAPPLGALDVAVERNAYGRQIDSFADAVDLAGIAGPPFPGVFIRAPRIRRVGDGVEVAVTRQGEPVGVRQGRVLGLCFHPELTGDLRLHRYFLTACCGLDERTLGAGAAGGAADARAARNGGAA